MLGGCFTLFVGREKATSRIFLATVGTVTFGAGIGAEIGLSPLFVNLVTGATVAFSSGHHAEGLELDARQITRLGRTLVLTTAIKLLVGVSLVTLTMFGVETALGSLGLTSQRELGAAAIVLGVLSLGTSPAIVLAVLSETRARGRLSELVLGAAVFKDLVVVVALAIARAVARTMLDPTAQLDVSLLGAVASELGGSILAGSLVGGIFIAYIRFVGAEMLLFVAAMILVVAEVCRALHLELLLVFITAGFVVRNLSTLERRLLQPLELIALPVFVVFFANAGASIELRTTWTILPLALALCAARTAGFVLASRLWPAQRDRAQPDSTREGRRAHRAAAVLDARLAAACRRFAHGNGRLADRDRTQILE